MFSAMQTQPTATADLDPVALPTVPPKTIGRFRVDGEIGRGANGVVYSAHDPVLGRDVAIKAMPLTVNNRVRERLETSFIKEARAVAGLNHPHIVTVFDAGRSETLAYIAMERLHGRDLHDYLASGTRPGLRQAAALMARIADAVHYANKRGLIHRDIKPSNIFLSRDMKPKVLDFGVAMPRGEGDPPPESRLVGTPNYMSPEQAQGLTIDARSDVFSLGAILYEMVTGHRAFEAPKVEDLLQMLVSDEPVPVNVLRPDAPVELVRIIAKAMAKDVEARYQTAGELRNDLTAFAGGLDQETPPAGPVQGGRRRLRWIAATAVAAAVAVGAGSWLMREDDPAPPEPSPVATAPAAEAAPAATEPPPEPSAEAKAPTTLARVKVTPPPPVDGRITLAIAPWGEVLVNGRSHGVSPPLTTMSLPPGSYSIEVRNGDLPPMKTDIDVRPGQSLTLRHRF
jgi:serine/threonine-protein kinase